MVSPVVVLVAAEAAAEAEVGNFANMKINFIITIIIVCALALYTNKLLGKVQRSGKFDKSSTEPYWVLSLSLVRELFWLIYALALFSSLWFFNVPLVSWLSYGVAMLLLVGGCLHTLWLRQYFEQIEVKKSLSYLYLSLGALVLAEVGMYFITPIAGVMLVVVIIWLVYLIWWARYYQGYTNQIKS